MLDKLTGIYAPRPSTGPHKLRECLPLAIILRNRLKYALNYQEAIKITHDKSGMVQVDGKTRSDVRFPCGFMDVLHLKPSNEYFRLLFDAKGRFRVTKITEEEAKTKILSVKQKLIGANNIPYLVSHDGRTIRYPHPDINVHDSIVYELASGEIKDHIKFEPGAMVMIIGGVNTGRVGHIVHLEKIDGASDIVHVRDTKGHTFATRIHYAFVIGKGKKSLVKLPKGDGIKMSIIEEQAIRHKA
jgi:small subunit ribosomal protein S4e